MWLAVLISRTSGACEPLPCWGSTLVPGDGATVPANLTSAAWEVDRAVALTARWGEQPLPVRVAQGTVALGEPLRPGDVVTFAADEPCRWGPKATPARWTVGPEAPLPEALGTLVVAREAIGPLVVGTDSGACSTEIRAGQVEVVLDPAPTAVPWLDALLFTTRVDGQPYVRSRAISEEPPLGASWVGRGRDLLYVDCSEDGFGFPGVSAGPHTVVLEARLPGRPEVWTTRPLLVWLTCEAPPPWGAAPGRQGRR